MTRPRKRQPHGADDLKQNISPTKTSETTGRETSWPNIWDTLSKVSLERDSLQEFNQRRQWCLPQGLKSPKLCPSHLVQFLNQATKVTDSTASPASSLPGTAMSSKATKGKQSLHGEALQRLLFDHGIYPVGYKCVDELVDPKPTNLGSICEELLTRTTTSLAASPVSASNFEDLQQKREEIVFEQDLVSFIIPLLCGSGSIANQSNILFTGFEPINDIQAARLKPDFFDGALLSDISTDVRKDPNIMSKIIPTKHLRVAVAPNFFLEIKGQRGTRFEAVTQACHDGAYGARAMHALQNYGMTESVYDECAYAFSSTYHDGILGLYVHHVTAPTAPGGRPNYHITKVGEYFLLGSLETFAQGVSAFRSARDLAKRYRDNFIRTANDRASQANLVVVEE